jgi:nucleotide-binding universal stress UspA family protein
MTRGRVSRAGRDARGVAVFGSVLAVVRADAARDAVVDRAVGLSVAGRAALTFVDVVGGDGPAAVAGRRGSLDRAVAAAGQAGVDATEAILQGDTSAEVIRMVLREGHDLVIAGPDAGQVLARDCPCDVLVVKPAGFVSPVTLHGGGAAARQGNNGDADGGATGEGQTGG